MRQAIVTTAFGAAADQLGLTFSSFCKVTDAELHAFVYGPALPKHRHPGIHYHLVEFDPVFRSVRRDALFRRWILPDALDAEYVLVVDGSDVVCIHPLPPFAELLRGAEVAAAAEWIGPVSIPGQGYTGSYLNAGVTFWHLPSSRETRRQIVERGVRRYRGPFDDQAALNEVIHTRCFDRLVVLPSQYNWRAMYRRNHRGWEHAFRAWPRVDSLEGVQLYHNQHCALEVLAAVSQHPPSAKAQLPVLPDDPKELSRWMLLWRRLCHRWQHT